MQTETKKINKKKPIIIAAVCIAAILIAVILIVTGRSGPGGSDLDVAYGDDISITTPYCTLHYPMDYKDDIEITSRTEEDAYYVDFTGSVGKEKMKFLTIGFGKTTAMPLGELEQPDGTTMPITMDIEVDDSINEWSDKDRNKLYEMQSGCKYLIDELGSLENFK